MSCQKKILKIMCFLLKTMVVKSRSHKCMLVKNTPRKNSGMTASKRAKASLTGMLIGPK